MSDGQKNKEKGIKRWRYTQMEVDGLQEERLGMKEGGDGKINHESKEEKSH